MKHQFTAAAMDISARRFRFPTVAQARLYHEYALYHVHDGDLTVTLKKQPILLHGGDTILVSPHTLHAVTSAGNGSVSVVTIPTPFFSAYLSKSDIGGAFREYCTDETSKRYYSHICFIRASGGDLVEQLLREQTGDHINRVGMMSALVIRLMVHLNRHSESVLLSDAGRQTTTTRVNDILSYIGEYWDTVDLSTLAARYGYSPEHISRMLLRQTGYHFTDILTEIKLEHAMEYLEKTRLTVAEISAKCGFISPAYFSRLFKKQTGIPPNRYRKEHAVSHRRSAGTDGS